MRDPAPAARMQIVRFKLCCNCAKYDTELDYAKHACGPCKNRDLQAGGAAAPSAPDKIIAEAKTKANQMAEEAVARAEKTRLAATRQAEDIMRQATRQAEKMMAEADQYRKESQRMFAEAKAAQAGTGTAQAHDPKTPAAPERLRLGVAVFFMGELVEATQGFTDAACIGRGGFGNVYVARRLRGMGVDSSHFAVKKFENDGVQGHAEFLQELQMLGGCRSLSSLPPSLPPSLLLFLLLLLARTP